MMSEDKPISEPPTTGDESDASAGKRTHSEDSDDDGVPLKQARMETAQDGVTDTEHQESDNSTHETSDPDAETTGPSENTEKVADDTGTSENAATVADDTGPSENTEKVADDTDTSENTETVADDTGTSENAATVADDTDPSENTATVADDSVPSENTATVADDSVPSENTATVAGDTDPSENTATVADDSNNVVENDSNITVSKPADATECEQTESDEKKRVEKKDSSPPSSEISESTDGVYDLSVKSVNKATAVKADKPDKGKALLPEMEENKENIQTGLNSYNGPIDLSTSKSSPDVIMLSDEDDDSAPLMNGHVNGNILELCAEKLLERQKLIRRLQEELRNEEAKLVLLKKIRQSQASLQVTEPEKSSQSTGHNSNKLHSSSSSSSSAQRNGSAGNVPPPLVRGGQTPAHTKSNNLTSQLLRTQQQQHHHQTHHRGGGGSSQNQGPPPLVMAPRSNTQSHLQHNSRGSHHPVTTAPNHTSGFRQVPQQTPQPPAQPEQTPAQRQAAAKLALRKQLEKTLLQIPPPKPPPPEMNFIPSLSSSDFILLVGLEETVKYITDTDKPKEKSTEVKYVFNPFTCVQCGTDFTPVWKRDKVGSRNVICEQCVTTNQKKALKQEHTNRLKSAFVKALQQEQEIEQRMQSQTNAAAAAAAAAAQAASSSSSSNSRETTTSSHGGSSNNAGAPMNLSTNFKPSRQQIQQHHNLIQAHQAHQAAQLRHQQLAGLQAFNQRLAFPFPLGNFQTGKPSDLHRQYLLDMIPPRSMPGGTVLWKS